MSFETEVISKLRWLIYDWIGAISVNELASNQRLRGHIEALFKKIGSLKTLEAV